MLFLNRLPRLNHPAFNIPDFTRATQDRYFLTVEEGETPLDSTRSRRRWTASANRPLACTRVPR